MTLATSGLTIPPAGTLTGTGTPAEQRLLTLAGAGSLVRLTYGRDTVGGRLLNILPLATGSTTLLVQVLWGYALDAVEELRLNGAALPAGSSVVHYLGTQTAVDADMASAMAAQGITYTSTLVGYAYSVIKLPTRSVGEQIEVTGRLRGRRVYDPRKDSTAGGSGTHRLALPATWEWSDCPALCHADFLANAVYGAGEAVDWASVATTANANDALVGGVERRRIIGLTMLEPAPVDDWSETLRAYSGCWLMATSAGIKMVPDAHGPAVATYTHAAGQIAALDALEMADLGDAPTVVDIVYTDTTQTPWRDATARAQLSGVGSTRPVRLSRIPLPGIQRYSQALREATERLNKLNLQSLSTRVELFDEGIAHQRGDIISLTHPAGLSAKLMRVTDVEMLASGQWSLAVTEHSAAVYSDSVVTRTSFGDASFISPAGPPSTPTGLSVSVTAAGNVVRWNANPESDVLAYELRVGGTDWASATPLVGSTPTRVGGTSYVWAPPASATYTLRLVAIDGEGLQSAAAVISAFVPAFEVGAANMLWGAQNGPAAAPNGEYGIGIALLKSAVTNKFGFKAGEWLTVSADLWQDAASAAAGQVSGLYLYTSVASGWNASAYIASASLSPERKSASFQLPADFDDCGVGLFHQGGSTNTIGTVFADRIQVERGTSATTYKPGFEPGATVGAPAGTYVGSVLAQDLVTTANSAASAAAAAQASANTANTALAAISSDSVLSRGEKPQVVQDWLAVSSERTGIVAQANAYGITTERDAYTTAHDALNTYLSGLSPAYSDTSTDTPINGASFRLYWVQLYDARQALLNRVVVGAQSAAVSTAAADATAKANAAQSAAQSYAAAQAALADTQARAYADGIVDAEEARAIADATAKAEAARVAAETAAAADATAKANVAALTATWSGVSGAGKPQDNATVGATFGVNIYGTAETVHLAATAVTNRVLFQDLTGDTRSNAT